MAIQAQPPAVQQATPYTPEQIPPLIFEMFEGVDTTTTRPGVPEKQAYWLDGFMPIANRNLRTLPDLGPTIFTRSGSLTISFFEFYNLNGTSYMIVFLSDGSAVQVNLADLTKKTVMPAATIGSSSPASVGVAQWGQQYLIIVSNQDNGYWIWDGNTLFNAGTLSPVTTLTNAGAGYTTNPAVIVSGGAGGGATAVAITSGGFVTGVTITNPGSGYRPGDSVSLIFTGGNAPGSGGALTANLTATAVVAGSGATFRVNMVIVTAFTTQIGSVTVLNGGSNYSVFTTMTLSGGNVGRAGVIVPVIVAGAIASVTIVDAGLYYGTVAPTASANDSGSNQYYVSSVTVNSAGSGYTPNARATCSGGGAPIAQAGLRLSLSASGAILAVTVLNGGLYGTNTPPTVAVTDSSANAAGTVSLMPFGIQGSSIETYQGYVWVAKGATIYNSAPGSVFDFSTSNGGGNKTSTSSKLRITYTKLISANGFLYAIADSSIDYISNVQTSGSPPSTTYSLLNADPETGTPYPDSVITFGRGLLMCNAFGIHVVYGSQAQKVSEAMDGVYTTVANFAGVQLSTAEHIIFGRKLACALVPIIDPVSGAQTNKILLWDGKRWFASSQSRTLNFIKHQEVNSIMTAYGTDGFTVAPLFTTPSQGFTKTAQSRLWDVGGYLLGLAASRFWSLVQFNGTTFSPFTVTIDNESGPGTAQTVIPNYVGITQWQNASGVIVSWTNNVAQVASWFELISAPGLFATAPQAVGQQGVLLGFTIKTTNPDFSLISAALQPELAQYRG